MVKKKHLINFGKNVWDEDIFIVEYKGAKNVLPESEIKRWISEIDDSETLFARKNNIQ